VRVGVHQDVDASIYRCTQCVEGGWVPRCGCQDVGAKGVVIFMLDIYTLD